MWLDTEKAMNTPKRSLQMFSSTKMLLSNLYKIIIQIIIQQLFITTNNIKHFMALTCTPLCSYYIWGIFHEWLLRVAINSNRPKLYWHRVPTISKSTWYLGGSPWKVLEFDFFLEKPLNFCANPWKVFEFSSTLNAVSWKVFLMFFGCPRQNVNHSSEKRWFS